MTPMRPGLDDIRFAPHDDEMFRGCGRSAPEDRVLLEVDHILPRSRGGTGALENLQALCRTCNIGRSNRDRADLGQGRPGTVVDEPPAR